MTTQTSREQASSGPGARRTYESWIESTGVPIHKGYFIEDLRTLDLGWWPERECNAAFLLIVGLEGVNEARVTEIPPGKTLPPLKFGLDELTYVVEGRGLCTVWAGDGKPKKTFEWQKHSLFMVPRNHYCQLSNAQGDRPVRLLHTNPLPLALTAYPEPDFFFNNPSEALDKPEGADGDLYAEAKAIVTNANVAGKPGQVRQRNIWTGNFFPDMRAWDKLEPFWGRGAGGTTVHMKFPGSPLWTHMSVFDAGTYKKAHRHTPGVVIVIPEGEGYSILWREGEEKLIVPWHEASVFAPPNLYFHQHFNVGSAGSAPARYLALHPAGEMDRTERMGELFRQIEYPEEDRFIRETFEKELAKRGQKSIMPEECYQDSNFEWDYSASGG